MQPKKNELLIKNLSSIFSEVRQKSLVQLENLAGMPVEEKIGYLQKALDDSEETVRNAAQAILDRLSSGVAPEAASPVPPVVQVPSEPSLPPLDPPPPPVEMPPDSPPPPEETAPEPEAPVAPAPVPALPEADDCMEAPPLDEEIDPALPSLNSLKGIPQKLEHIRYLSQNKPSGIINQLLELVLDQIEEVSLTALQALLKLKDPRTPLQVIPMLAIPGFSSQRRFVVLKIVMDSNVTLNIPQLRMLLMNEKDVIIKSGLVKVFARSAGEAGTEILKKCLFDEDPRVRANTVEVIEEQGIHGCDADIAELLNDKENRVKVNTAKYLVKQGHPEAFHTLKTMLGSSEVWLRDSVIFALGEIGDQSSLTLLKAALKDPNQGIRLSVLKALAKVNNGPSRECLQAAESDADQVVSQVARSLWEKIKDKPISPPPSYKKALPKTAEATTPASLKSPSVLPSSPPPPTILPKPPAPAVPPISKPPSGMELPALDSLGSTPRATAPVQPLAPAVSKLSVQAPPAVSTPTAPRPLSPVLPSVKPAAPTTPPPAPQRVAPSPAAAPPLKPATAPPVPAPVVSGEAPIFQKPRSAELYVKLCSGAPDQVQAAMKDLPFIAGDDQVILVAVALQNPDDSVRLAAAKVLSRKRGPQAVNLMQTLVGDSSEIVSTFAQKALTMMK